MVERVFISQLLVYSKKVFPAMLKDRRCYLFSDTKWMEKINLALIWLMDDTDDDHIHKYKMKARVCIRLTVVEIFLQTTVWGIDFSWDDAVTKFVMFYYFIFSLITMHPSDSVTDVIKKTGFQFMGIINSWGLQWSALKFKLFDKILDFVLDPWAHRILINFRSCQYCFKTQGV